LRPRDRMTAGYSHQLYADSLAEFGSPIHLARCDGWSLKRQVPGSEEVDAMGCYPLFTCDDWEFLRADLDGLSEGLVSLALVTDPFGDYSESYLRECFRDVVIPFKEHFVA